ncbi:MAG: heme exporter protein CcmD [Rhodospirillaceae bacterium]|jgi:heme exporter protein CcmD
MNWSHFFDMGGYGAFVWPAFLISAAVLLVMLIVSLRNLKTQSRMLEQLERSESEH